MKIARSLVIFQFLILSIFYGSIIRAQDTSIQQMEDIIVDIENNRDIKGKSVNLRNIQFKKSSAELDQNTKFYLDKVAEFLIKVPTIGFSIEAHTSSEGSSSFNQKLSEERAVSVREYLIFRGVNSSVIQSIGYGESRPITGNETEDERELNRRAELFNQK